MCTKISKLNFLYFLFQRQPAFDSFEGANSLFTGYFPSLNEDQTVQEVPTGLDSISYGKYQFNKCNTSVMLVNRIKYSKQDVVQSHLYVELEKAQSVGISSYS